MDPPSQRVDRVIIFLIVVTLAVMVATARRRSVFNHRDSGERARAYEDFIDGVLISLQSGATVSETLRIAVDCTRSVCSSELAALVARLERGEPLRTVVGGLADVFGPRSYPLIDILHSSLADGMPVLHIIERLADEARAERRRQLNEELRRLPIRLVFPLVFCVLPSFVLLTIVPVGFHALSSLSQGATP